MMKADDDEMAQEKRDFDTRSSTSSDERSDTINRRAAEAKLDQIDLDSGGEESEPDESKRQREQKAVAEHKELRIETKIHALSAADEDSEGNYQLVKKSIYKASKKGFLSRLTGAASPAQGKYLVSEITGITTEEATSDGLQLTKSKLSDSDIGNDTGNDNAETAFEEEEGIQVSIDRSGQYARTDFTNSDRRRLNAEDAALGGPSEVIIHSGDSESGFATLNPVIRGSLKLSSGANCTPSHGGLPSPAMTKSSGIPVVKASPVLLEIPAAEEKNHPKERLQLIINALGATGLPKAEKFGTQSCLLEMKLFDINGGNTNSFLMRTELHKKGGSEAQWNQQFSTTLWSKESQFLHAEVKTSSKALVGEADIRLDKVADLFYDQHYPLFRSEDSGSGDESLLVAAGQLHLQLKIVDTVATASPPPIIPPLRLPISPSSEGVRSNTITPLGSKPIPTVLLNGGLFFKIPYHTHNVVGYASGPRRQWVSVRRATNPPHLQITWGDPTRSGAADKKSARSLDLALVTEIRQGHTTTAFAAQTDSNVVKEEGKCFSLVTRARSLDLVAASKEEAHIWVSCLRELLFASGESPDDAVVTSARTIEGYIHSALSSREPGGNELEKSVAAVPSKRMIAAWRNRIFNLARHNRLDEIVECLEDGCPVDLLESGTGDTLLMLACRLGNDPLVDLCLSRRAKNDPHPEFGETALQVAVKTSHSHCVGLLLSTAAKSDMDSEIVNHIDPNNDAPLHVAARHGDLACLQLLLHHGADICVVEEFGRTPLHCAVAKGNIDCIAYLLDVGGDSVLNSGDHDGDTALHYAALSGNEAAVKLLVESAANVFATNIHKETAYDIAVREKQQKCAELISKYFLTNEKETAYSSFTRNEAASVLLERLKEDQANLGYRNASGTIDEQRVPAYVDETEVWRNVQPAKVIEFGDAQPAKAIKFGDDYEAYPVKHQPSSYIASGSATSRTILSPSEQVRDALARTHRANSVSPTSFTQAWSGSTSNSAREASRFSSYAAHNERLVATERIDREQNYQFQPYPIKQSDPPYPHNQHWDSYSFDKRYIPYATSPRGETTPRYAQPTDAYWSRDRPVNNRVPNPQGNLTPTAAWSNYNHTSTQLYPQQFFDSQVEASQWDTLYTDEGYPYYVNRTTGISQWEKPATDERSVATNEESQPDSNAEVLSPGAIIRLRLAEVRKQKSQATLVSPVSSEATSCSTVTPGSQHPAATRTTEATCPSDQAHSSTKTVSAGSTVDCSKTSTEQSQTESLEQSKYEARTGLKLSVDISAPQSQDVSRPVFVPSPRSKSPVKKFLEAEGVDDNVTRGSFEKSRASSPRGRSKNIQLIELKRANNLTLALASFKIHDHYEQIVSDIVSMDERVVNPALLGCLQRFFPTAKEKQALESFTGSISTLGKAERFFCLLFQVPGMQERIDMFLYKMEFSRTHSRLLSQILIVKRACRDLVENYSFIQALEQFFKRQSMTSFLTFRDGKATFVSEFLSEVDEKLRSFRDDLKTAMRIELMELQLQLNRLVAGIQPIRSFVERSPSSKAAKSDERDSKARDILHRFLADTRHLVAEIESEFESMELWGDKLLAVFGESKATCHTSAILEAVFELL